MKQLNDWLGYIERAHPRRVDFTLERIRAVANAMQLLPVPYKVITVAGTNGKGTTATLLATIYQQAGYQVGLHTSPHLLKFNERIVMNGEPVNDATLVEAFTMIETARGAITLSYFEYAVLAALYCFRQAQLQVVVLEIGVGGRLDACNIVDPDVAVITTVELDHTEWLGDNREKIAVEKAGIFREYMPAVCGDLDCPQAIRQRAEKLRAPLFCQLQDFYADVRVDTWDWHCKLKQYTGLPIPAIPVQNAATALMAVQCLQHYLPVGFPALAKALEVVQVPGRFQCLHLHCPIILDVAHNVAAAQWLAEKLAQEPCAGKTIAVFSALKDKDVSGMLAQMDSVVDEWHYAPLAVERALDRNHLDAVFDYIKTRQAHASIDKAFDAALAAAAAEDRIIIFGSFFTVAALLPDLQQRMMSK